MGWACGAYFFYSAYQQGAPFGIWVDVFAPALCAAVGGGLAFLFSRKPAVRYLPKPVEITINNVDIPTMESPQKKRLILKFAGICVWLGIMVLAGQKGSKYGVAKAIANRDQIKHQQDLTAENERQIQKTWDLGHSSPESATNSLLAPQSVGMSRASIDASTFEKIRNTAHEMPIAPFTISKLNSGEIEDLILNIYARHGAIFESAEARRWAAQQPWYKAVPGKTIKDTDKEFDYITQTNVNRLVERWNRIQVDEGHAPLPVDETPLAGRGVSPDIETDAVPYAPVVLKALPLDGTSSGAQGNLSREEIEGWNLARVKYEINQIYARHGVVFPKQEIQSHFEKQAWYKPVPGLTFDQAEEGFSTEERHDIEALADRRTLLTGGNQPQAALPVSEPLRLDLVTTWDAARVRNEINSIYARYGVDFTNAELRKWADKQPGYKCVPSRTFADAEELFTDTDRSNIKLLATRRTQISSGN